MLNKYEVGVPGVVCVLLVGAGGVAVVEVECGVLCSGECGDVDPSDEVSCGVVVVFDLMSKFVAVLICESEVISVGLCFVVECCVGVVE